MLDLKEQFALQQISRARSTSEEYMMHMAYLGREIADKKVVKRSPGKQSYHAICSVEDFDHIFLGAVSHLRKSGRTVHFSCFWSEHEIFSRKPFINASPCKRVYEQSLTEKSYELIVVAGAVGSVTPIETMLLHVLSKDDCPHYTSITILTPFIHRKAMFDLRRKVAAHFDRELKWCGYRIEKKLNGDGSPRPGLGMTSAARMGLADVRVFRMHMPAHIKRLISRSGDFNPDDSPLGTPPRSPSPEFGLGIVPSLLEGTEYSLDLSFPTSLASATHVEFDQEGNGDTSIEPDDDLALGLSGLDEERDYEDVDFDQGGDLVDFDADEDANSDPDDYDGDSTDFDA